MMMVVLVTGVTVASSDEEGHKVYTIHGPLYFGSIARFRDFFNPAGDVEDDIVLDFRNAREMVGVNMIDDPHYGVVVNYSDVVEDE